MGSAAETDPRFVSRIALEAGSMDQVVKNCAVDDAKNLVFGDGLVYG